MQSSPTSAKYRVLVVDDNEDIHEDFRLLLQPTGGSGGFDDLLSEVLGDEPAGPPVVEMPDYEFDFAFQGRAALDVVQGAIDAGKAFALAFVDIRMPPGWNGVETIRHLWEVDPNMQVIICSAYSDYSWEDIVGELGPSDKLLFLRKPFDPNAVKQMALATTSRWHNDGVVRDKVQQLEHRLAHSEERLAALNHAPGATPEQRDLRSSLRQLREAIDTLTGTALSADQMHLLDQARAACASLERITLPPSDS